MLVKVLSEKIVYTGAELRPQWISSKTGHYGDAVVAFLGGCKVPTHEMVDLVDRRSAAFIEAGEMLHFLGEWFDGDLRLAVTRQRLFVASFVELLNSEIPTHLSLRFERRGNDIYSTESEKRKLSVSIVTASAVSTLFHFGVNIDATGAPVKAIGLREVSIDAHSLGEKMLKKWQEEWSSMEVARCKVDPR